MKRLLIITYILAGVASVSLLSSCQDFLDKSKESSISAEDAYKNFTNFQGFTEELYYCLPDFAKGYWTNSFNWGEEESTGTRASFHFGYKIDNGDFWGWQSQYDGWSAGWMDRAPSDMKTTDNDRFHKSLWKLGWYGIRKTNIGLANMDKLVDATQEEKNIIEGQLLFFRAWFHFMFIQYFGGLPYVDEVLPGDQKLTLSRLKYQEAAERVAQDLRRAADLLPNNWDETVVGRRTAGKNQLRITKGMALGYLGKNLLWAGSPLMNEESTGSSTYNTDYCQRAAEVFGELLALCDAGQAPYKLMPFDKYSDIFYTNGQNWLMPGGTEAMFRSPSYEPNGTNWGLAKQYVPQLLEGDDIVFAPTANYVAYYGMANGLRLEDAGSGYNPEHPWKGRDPRFYHDIVFDGVRCIQGSGDEANRYANLYTNGSYRGTTGSVTGYLLYKFIPRTGNKYDDGFGYGKANHIHLSWMRLADVYLMYAESVVQGYGTPTSKANNYSMSAVDAINALRDRVGAAHVNAKYLAGKDEFMSEVRRERAVELAYEGHRFNDLRRWLLLTEYPYTIKTAIEFTRGSADGLLSDLVHPEENRVLNLRETVLLERKFQKKHYWLPLKSADVNMYLEFSQNPGW